MVFKSDSSPGQPGDDANLPVLLAAAAAVSPVNELNGANRAALCRTAAVTHVQRNDVVKPEASHRWMMFLVEGSLSLYNGKEEVGQLASGSKDALQPLFVDKTAYQSVRTPSMARIVKFGREQLDILLREQQRNAIHVIDVEVGELENVVFEDILADMLAHKPSLPSSPDAAARILEALPNVAGIPELAEIIQSDPGLTACIVNAANRAEAGNGADATTSIRGAISRLGVGTTQRTIKELLANPLQPGSPIIARRFNRYTRRATLSAAIVQVLARSVPELKAEVAALVALSADIGELLVLGYANRHAERFENEQQLATTVEKLRTVLSIWLLSSWDFPAAFVEAATISRDWYRNHSGEITYTDLVTGSLLIIQSETPDTEPSSIPSAGNLLLARRLQQAGIDLTAPGEIIKAATSRLVSVQALLKAS